MRTKDVIPGVFSRHAASYRSRIMGAVGRREARGRVRLLERLAARPGERVLDLGCGPGTLTFTISSAVGDDGQVVAVDIAEGMLDLVHAERRANVAVARMDIERLALRSAAFDGAACGHALQFCPDLAAALAEARRVLRPGGRFAASYPGTSGRHALRVGSELFQDLLPPAPAFSDRQATLEALRDTEHMRTLLRAAGFEQGDVEPVDELISYEGPEDLIEKTMSWWDCAWRLEMVPESDRERIRAEALSRLRKRTGDGPLELSGTTLVVFATA